MKIQTVILLQSFLLFFAYGHKVTNEEVDILSRHKRFIGKKDQRYRGSCKGVYTGRKGHIASPNYPFSKYPGKARCKWSIVVTRGFVVKVTFKFMDMENGPAQIGGDCGQDSLVLYDGRDESYPMIGNQKYCGYETKFNPVYSTSNIVHVVFRSDNAVEKEGFLLLYRRAYPPKDAFDCDFENANGLCPGWKQSQGDDFNWSFTNGPTHTGKKNITGPRTDHTLKTSEGVYAYIEATGKPVNFTAVLISPTLDLSKAQAFCLTFWYHMNGTKVGSLDVYQTMEDTNENVTKGELIFSLNGRQSSHWKLGRVNITGKRESTRILFSGVRGGSFAGDIALDDIAIRKRLCPPIKQRKKKKKLQAPIITTTTPKTIITTTIATTTTVATLPPQATPGSSTSDCPTGFYSCRTRHNCIDNEFLCDGIQDCAENDDENNCEPSTTSPPSNCFFNFWSGWSECSVTCGGGSKKNTRSTVNGEAGDPGCEGISSMSENCNTEPCPSWSKWEKWERCTASCGGGRQSRIRKCENGKIGEGSCVGPYAQFINCNGHNCPKWGVYGSWSNCPVTCGHGIVSRTRTCLGGKVRRSS